MFEILTPDPVYAELQEYNTRWIAHDLVKTMSWNYRVMKRGERFAVYAVYYDEGGKIQGWTETAFSPEADSLEELRTTLELMLASLHKEIVEYKSPIEDD
jgi:hypothetical protein